MGIIHILLPLFSTFKLEFNRTSLPVTKNGTDNKRSYIFLYKYYTIGKAFFQIAGVFAELKRSMINARTKASIEKAKAEGVKFGRIARSKNKNKNTDHKVECIKIFLAAKKAMTGSLLNYQSVTKLSPKPKNL